MPPHLGISGEVPEAVQTVPRLASQLRAGIPVKGGRRRHGERDTAVAARIRARQLYVVRTTYGQVAETIVTLVTFKVCGFMEPMSCAR